MVEEGPDPEALEDPVVTLIDTDPVVEAGTGEGADQEAAAIEDQIVVMINIPHLEVTVVVDLPTVPTDQEVEAVEEIAEVHRGLNHLLKGMELEMIEQGEVSF